MPMIAGWGSGLMMSHRFGIDCTSERRVLMAVPTRTPVQAERGVDLAGRDLVDDLLRDAVTIDWMFWPGV